MISDLEIIKIEPHINNSEDTWVCKPVQIFHTYSEGNLWYMPRTLQIV